MANSQAPKHILLVEDEPSVIFALKLLLEALGFEVKDFLSAPDALVYLDGDDSIDLCICDLRMPKMNGLQVLEEMKKRRSNLPFVLMSAHASELEIQKATQLGADGFLSKPFTPEDLQGLIALIFPD